MTIYYECHKCNKLHPGSERTPESCRMVNEKRPIDWVFECHPQCCVEATTKPITDDVSSGPALKCPRCLTDMHNPVPQFGTPTWHCKDCKTWRGSDNWHVYFPGGQSFTFRKLFK